MIKEDSLELRKFIYANGLSEAFQKKTDTEAEAWSHILNIDIACDLDSNDSLHWKSYNKKHNGI